MNTEQAKLFTKMRKLIKEGKRRFENRPDRDYLEDLLELGIGVEEAWNYIYTLNYHYYFPDAKPNYYRDVNSLTFKRDINGTIAYIKLKIETRDKRDETVCLSFHKDNKNRRLKNEV